MSNLCYNIFILLTSCVHRHVLSDCLCYLTMCSVSINHKKSPNEPAENESIFLFFFFLLGHRATGCDYLPLPRHKFSFQRTPCKGANIKTLKYTKKNIRRPNSLRLVNICCPPSRTRSRLKRSSILTANMQLFHTYYKTQKATRATTSFCCLSIV